MTPTVMAGDTRFLPEEIIRNILMRLPVKSLLRLRCVCKDWRNLIKTPYFMYEHLHHSTHRNPYLLFQLNGLRLLDCKMQLHKISEVPLIDSSIVVGSSNGLLCFHVIRYHTFSPDIFLWNPATKEFREVPPNTKVVDLRFKVGFGFSPIVNDYKIVLTHESNHEVAHVEVYSLRSGSWKDVEFGIENVGFISQQITASGAIFWFGVRWEPAKARLKSSTVYDVIVSFDIANEVFSLIPTPDRLAPTSTSRFAVYENKLALLSFSPIHDSESMIKLWLMEDGTDTSWVKIYNCHISLLAYPLTIWMNQIVCHVIKKQHAGWNHELEIALLNISTNELKMFDINGTNVAEALAVALNSNMQKVFNQFLDKV